MTTFSLPNDYLFPKVEGNFRNFFIADICELKNFKISKNFFICQNVFVPIFLIADAKIASKSIPSFFSKGFRRLFRRKFFGPKCIFRILGREFASIFSRISAFFDVLERDQGVY